jgi:hypothetical protein
MPSPRLIQRIATLSALLGAVCALTMGGIYGVHSGISAAVGTLIGVLNIWALAKLVGILLDGTSTTARKGRAAVLLGAKSIALIAVVGVLVINGHVRGGALMAGLSIVALSIVLAGALPGGDDSSPPPPGGDDSSSHRSLS